MPRLLPSFVLFFLAAVHAESQDVHVRVSPDVKTGIEATDAFPTIQMALDHHPFAGPAPGKDGQPARVYLEIAPGIYRERIIVTQNHHDITLLGMGKTPADVVVTNALNAKQAGGTFFTETAEINGDGFQADNLTLENTAGNTGQAVAAAVRADRVIFKHCRLLGHQDTLFADAGRQYYVNTYIEGGVDFLFGNAAAVFDRDELHFNGPGYLTAHSRTAAAQPTGFVILRSRVTFGVDQVAPSDLAGPSRKVSFALGRPWRPYARVIVMHTELPNDLNPAGWNNWGTTANETTAFFAEYENTGPGAGRTDRVPWSRQLTAAEAAAFLPATFLRGTDRWNPEAEAARLP